MMKRTISGMTGTGSLAHNRRDFIAENVNQNRVYLNICYRDENLKDVYKELFDESVERYNVGKRNDRKITNYYDKIQHGKQEKLFHEVIFQIGNNKDMAAPAHQLWDINTRHSFNLKSVALEPAVGVENIFNYTDRKSTRLNSSHT